MTGRILAPAGMDEALVRRQLEVKAELARDRPAPSRPEVPETSPADRFLEAFDAQMERGLGGTGSVEW